MMFRRDGYARKKNDIMGGTANEEKSCLPVPVSFMNIIRRIYNASDISYGIHGIWEYNKRYVYKRYTI